MDAFLSELKTVKLRRSSNSFSADASFSSIGSNSFNNSTGSSETSFSFPKLRKVVTLPNGKKVSDLDASTRRPRGSGIGVGGGVGDESVVVDLTLMDRDEPPSRVSNISGVGPARRLTERDRARDSQKSSRFRALKNSRLGRVDSDASDTSTEPRKLSSTKNVVLRTHSCDLQLPRLHFLIEVPIVPRAVQLTTPTSLMVNTMALVAPTSTTFLMPLSSTTIPRPNLHPAHSLLPLSQTPGTRRHHSPNSPKKLNTLLRLMTSRITSRHN